MIKARIVRQFDDYDPVILGQVQIDGISQDDLEDFIDTAWERFQKTEPNSDSEFIKYLTDNFGCVKIKDEFINTYVG